MLPQPPSSTSENTRREIIRAAEHLFAEKGFRAMTLREITLEAKVNLAAANYHFGSKCKLMREVIRNRIEPINHERMQRLDALTCEYAPNPIPIQAIFDALFRPLFEACTKKKDPNQALMQMIGRAISEPASFMQSLHKDLFSELSHRFMTELRRSCPDLTETAVQYRFFLSIGTMIGTIIDQGRLENLTDGKLNTKNDETILQELTAYVVAGFRQYPAQQ